MSETINGNMTGLEFYNQVREVPQEAKKTIQAGRTKGFTDINPMWRIKTLTKHFGIVGIGWYYAVKKMWLEHGANDEIAAFVEIDLFIKYNGEWSKPITGVGGSSFVAKERNGLYTSDECFKMALTDAMSVSCKALGIGADVYFEKDKTKYDAASEYNNMGKGVEPDKLEREYKCVDCKKPFTQFTHKGEVYSAEHAYYEAMRRNPDDKARCKGCRERKEKETLHE